MGPTLGAVRKTLHHARNPASYVPSRSLYQCVGLFRIRSFATFRGFGPTGGGLSFIGFYRINDSVVENKSRIHFLF